MTDNKLYKTIWYGVSAVLIAMLLTVAYTNITKHYKTNETLYRMVTGEYNG